ncbi:hypothetical protein M404DRAFT_145947 [Pisolithus tinctorius Marx 270]|uniref:CCHC-type domain-containing protein n=1 Tax=Pisolithus tinctorius Marx 270 TaxID=870435 RepID=A0A0C3K0W2_PISTI|nr:hypothetical protein M404DRAFT_145947 [Pisolithus tinctorius Marx 270]
MDPAQPQPPAIDYTMVQAMAVAMAQVMQQYMPAPAAAQTTNFDPTKRGVTEPRTFNGSVAKYEEWAICMRAYCKAALDLHLANGNWPSIDEVVADLNSLFQPMNNGDWAQKKMQKARQGQSQMDAFLVESDSWKLMASASNDLAILCLEQAINPEYITELLLVAGNFENHQYMMASSLRVWPQNQPCGFSTTGTQPRAGAPMDIGATPCQGKGKGPPKDKSHIMCFGCGLKGHYRSECPKQAQPQGCPVRAVNTDTGPDPRLKAMEGMSFKQIVAHINQLKESELQ